MATNSSRTTFKIIVDADSCPVKDIILEVARLEKTPVVLVASISHMMPLIGVSDTDVNVMEVDNLPQAVDMAIINRVKGWDIVVTGDYGLASVVLSKGALPLSPRGYVYTEHNIDRLLLQRHIDARIRRGGGKTRGPKAFSQADRQRFEESLRRLISTNRLNKEISP